MKLAYKRRAATKKSCGTPKKDGGTYNFTDIDQRSDADLIEKQRAQIEKK
jgi:hypothetical protein